MSLWSTILPSAFICFVQPWLICHLASSYDLHLSSLFYQLSSPSEPFNLTLFTTITLPSHHLVPSLNHRHYPLYFLGLYCVLLTYLFHFTHSLWSISRTSDLGHHTTFISPFLLFISILSCFYSSVQCPLSLQFLPLNSNSLSFQSVTIAP